MSLLSTVPTTALLSEPACIHSLIPPSHLHIPHTPLPLPSSITPPRPQQSPEETCDGGQNIELL